MSQTTAFAAAAGLPLAASTITAQLRPRHRLRGPALTVLALLPFALGYFVSYFVRTINGAAADGFVRELGVGPADLGVMTSLYFLTFAAFQMPAGVLIDRYGPFRVQAGLFVVEAAGALVFASSQNLAMLMLGRALLGMGCAGALLSGMKMLALVLRPERRALGNCALVMAGGLGAMASAAPIGRLLPPGDWRSLFLALAVIALAISAVLWRQSPAHTARGTATAAPTLGEITAGLLAILRDARFWRMAPLSASVVGAAFALHGLWAAHWLADVAGLASSEVSRVLLLMGASLTVGAAGFGVLATALRRRGVSTMALFRAAATGLIGIEAAMAWGSTAAPALLMAGLALFGAITVLSFTALGELFPPATVGRANAALNVLHLGGAFVLQSGIGLIAAFWPADVSGHLPQPAYGSALAAVIAVQILAIIWYQLQPRFAAAFR